LAVENTVVYSSRDLAYTVGFEQGDVVVDDEGTKRPMVIRVTHIYRRFGDDWKLVHRHADFTPEEQPQTQR
jgi:ketosteroid isomerase-like protein